MIKIKPTLDENEVTLINYACDILSSDYDSDESLHLHDQIEKLLNKLSKMQYRQTLKQVPVKD